MSQSARHGVCVSESEEPRFLRERHHVVRYTVKEHHQDGSHFTVTPLK